MLVSTGSSVSVASDAGGGKRAESTGGAEGELEAAGIGLKAALDRAEGELDQLRANMSMQKEVL